MDQTLTRKTKCLHSEILISITQEREWDGTGYVTAINSLNEDNALNHLHHAVSIFVKMDPDDKGPDDASIGLTLSEYVSKENVDQIANLDIGTKITFNGTLVGMGDPGHLHHLHAYGV